MSSGKSIVVVGSMHVFVACQIGVLNKPLVSPLSWNNLLSETSLGESYILTIYRHLHAKEKHLFDAEGVFITYSFIKKITCFKYILTFSAQFLKVHSCRY